MFSLHSECVELGLEPRLSVSADFFDLLKRTSIRHPNSETMRTDPRMIPSPTASPGKEMCKWSLLSIHFNEIGLSMEYTCTFQC